MALLLLNTGRKAALTFISMLDSIRKSWYNGGMLVKLIWVNVVVFFIMTLLPDDEIILSVPTDFQLLLKRPWTIVTHMFAHNNIFHFFSNMIFLWWVGRMYQAEVGTRRLLSMYVLGGFSGILFVLLSIPFNVYNDESATILGASSAVYAILAALATLNPDRKIVFGSVTLKTLLIVILVLNYFKNYNDNAMAMVGHYGGAFIGYFLVTQERKGRDFARWLEWIFDTVMSMIPSKTSSRNSNKWGAGKVWRKNRFANKAAAKKASNLKKAPKSDDKFNSERRESQEKLDVILDKISRHGYDHLTKEEKQFLFKQSNK